VKLLTSSCDASKSVSSLVFRLHDSNMNLGEKVRLKGDTYTKSNKCCGTNEFLLAVLCCIFSPLAVFLWSGADKNLLINIILFILGFIPGVVHGMWLLAIYFVFV
jgi:uncharacterized membrane protein YqaE (UPF0057 family)